MIPFKDKTYCASPDCKNECRRKMTKKEEEQLEELNQYGDKYCVSYAYFCGEPNDEDESYG